MIMKIRSTSKKYLIQIHFQSGVRRLNTDSDIFAYKGIVEKLTHLNYLASPGDGYFVIGGILDVIVNADTVCSFCFTDGRGCTILRLRKGAVIRDCARDGVWFRFDGRRICRLTSAEITAEQLAIKKRWIANQFGEQYAVGEYVATCDRLTTPTGALHRATIMGNAIVFWRCDELGAKRVSYSRQYASPEDLAEEAANIHPLNDWRLHIV